MISRSPTLRDHLHQCLDPIGTTSNSVDAWRTFLGRFSPVKNDDEYVLLACALALKAVSLGNFGVGALLARSDGSIVEFGHNQVYHPYFRSDLHAEMVVLNAWEDGRPDSGEGLTLFTSLEPCPMCTVRISTSRVSRIRHVAPDPTGGMFSRIDELPPFWRSFAATKSFAAADCSAELIHVSQQILQLNLKELSDRVIHRDP